MKKLIVTTLFAVLQFADSTIAAQVSFKPAQGYPVGTAPASVAVGDLNGDGIPDLVVANQGSNNVSVLLGKGDGTFQPAVNFDVGVSPYHIVAADINGDGKLDIAVPVDVDTATSSPGSVSFLIGNGDGTFQPPIVLTLTLEQNPFTLADVNGDKKADLIVNLFGSNGNPAGVSVALGDGDGTFQAPKTVTNAHSVSLVADFNGDGKPDLAVNQDTVFQFMFGNGDGTFSAGPHVSPSDGGGFGRIWAVDLNSDGKLDPILESGYITSKNAECSFHQDIGVFLSNGGTFGSETTFLSGECYKANPFATEIDDLITDIAIGDFNGDGNVDAANRAFRVNTSNPPFAVNLGDGAGNFTAVALPDPGPLAAAADLNGDQLTDLVVLDTANNNVAVLVNSTPVFSIAAATSTLTVSAGQQVTDTLTLASINGFPSPVQLSCQVIGPSPLPTCGLSPSNVTPGTAPTNTTLTIAPGSSASLRSPVNRWLLQSLYALALPLALAGLGSRRRRPGSTRSLMITLLGAASLLCTACGQGSNTQSVSNPKSYTVQVTAASGALTKNLHISLTVQ
jgi:hypothetical protein